MKRTLSILALIGAFSFAGNVAASDCRLPDKPAIPDGAVASAADMFKAKKAVDEFIKTGESMIQSCRLNPRKHNSTITQMERVASEFNKSLKVYKSKA